MRFPETFIDDLRRQADIVRVISDYVPLKKKGTNWMACCPFHNEKSPSFGVNPAREMYKCFGCLDEDELIWTRCGLKRIGDVHTGERVLDKNGAWQQVLAVDHKPTDELLGFTTAAFRHDPLWLTPDHTCIYAEREHVIASLPYVYKTADREVRFSLSKKHTRRIGKYRDKLKLSQGRADELKTGDYIVFPVIGEEERSSDPLSTSSVINPRENRVNGIRVAELPINERTARLYGLWLAEGSVGRGFVRWTFHADQRETLAAEIVSTLKDEFGLCASIYHYPEKPNTCEVNCSKTDLALALVHWFGRGAARKRLPAEALRWHVDIQKAFLSGYRDGDGDKRNVSKSVSRQLSYGIFALAVQARENIALYRRDSYSDKNDLRHKECWEHYPRSLESCKGFYETVENTEYYFSPIVSIERNHVSCRVVDITVSDTSSFTTKMGVVHNCGEGGNVFTFVMKIENVSFPEAVKLVAEKMGVALPEDEGKQRSEAERRAEQERARMVARVLELNDVALAWWEDQLQANTGEARAAREYVAKRGISDETRGAFRLGFAPDRWDALLSHLRANNATDKELEASGLVVKKENGFYDRFRGRLIFPVLDVRGRAVAFGGRTMSPEGEPKYLNSPETPAYTKGRHLYGLHQAVASIRKRRFVILVEGYLDLVIPYQYGERNMVASLGTALTPDQAKMLRRFASKIVVNYDGDKAGRAAAKRAIQVLLVEDFDIKVLVLLNDADPDDFVRSEGVDEYRNQQGKILSPGEYALQKGIDNYNRQRGSAVTFIQFILEEQSRERDLSRAADKAEAVSEVLPFLRAVRDQVQRREYFDYAMDALRVDRDMRGELWQSIRTSASKAVAANAVTALPQGRAQQTTVPSKVERQQPTIAERQLLELLVNDEELRRDFLPHITEEDYVGTPSEMIFRHLKQVAEDDSELDLTSFAESLPDDSPLADVVALLQMSSLPLEFERAQGEADDALRAKAESCLAAMRLVALDKRSRRIAAEIAAAQRAGDSEALVRLTGEDIELKRRRQTLLPRTSDYTFANARHGEDG